MPKTQPSHFGKRLRELRTAAGLSQSELAKRCGLHEMVITKIEAGQRQEPAWGTVVKLARGLDKTCDEFLKGEPAAARPAKRKRK